MFQLEAHLEATDRTDNNKRPGTDDFQPRP